MDSRPRTSKYALSVVIILLEILIISANAPSDIRLDEKAKSLHRVDCLNILAYVFLMIITVCTIWLFKHRRARFLHETGLAIIYGLIVGVIIRYAGEDSEVSNMKVLPDETNNTVNIPPDNLYLPLQVIQSDTSGRKKNKTYAYVFRGEATDVEGKKLDQKATFDPEIFFNIILPPIIFNAGYSLKRKHFFRNLGTIMTFAFIGTTVSCFAVGLVMWAFLQLMPHLDFSFNDCLYFGAIISATDPVTVLAIFHDLHVDVNLFAMVFGESILNDAVAIVLASSISGYSETSTTMEGDAQWKAALKSIGNFLYVFVCSLMIGSVTGCFTAILTKFTRLCDFSLLESCLFVLMSYSTFLIAEAADLTGIVAVLFCGICQAHYTYNNLSSESRARTKQLFELLNFLSENFIFTYIGVSMFTYQKHHWDAAFIIIALLSIAIGRAVHIYPLSFLLNLGRHNKIPFNFQHMLFFSGLRGAMAFALAIRNTLSEARHLILTATSFIVILTVIVCGGLTTQLLAWLGIPVGVEEEHEMLQFTGMRMVYNSMDDGVPPQVQTPTELRSPATTENKTPYEKAWLVRKWYSFDVKYMKPFLTHSRPTLMDTMPACCLSIARLLTSTQQLSTSCIRIKQQNCQSYWRKIYSDDSRRHDEDSDTDLCIDESELVHNSRPPTVSRTVSRSHSEENVTYSPSRISESVIEGDLGLTSGLIPMTQTRVSLPGFRGQHL